jgi:hypothetical protein
VQRHAPCKRRPLEETLRMAKAMAPERLARNVFLLMAIGIAIEIVVMVILPRV